MILYHFTDFYFLKNGGTILQTGLRAGAHDEVDLAMAPADAVWLSTDAEETWKRKSECRITVVIPSTDRRLVRWQKWMRKRHPPHIAEQLIAACGSGTGDAWKNFWLYLSPVPLSTFGRSNTPIRSGGPRLREARLHPELYADGEVK